MADMKIKANVTGKVWKIEKQERERVDAGEEITILESIKMEIPIEPPIAGVIVLTYTATRMLTGRPLTPSLPAGTCFQPAGS